MGIQINGNTNNINAGIGSLSIEDLNELDIVGVATASNFKTGSSNLHSTGLTVGNSFVHSTGVNLGTGVTFSNSGDATFSGIVTATSFVGSGANLTGLPAGTTINTNADNRIITGSGTANTLNGEANLTYDGTTLNNESGSGASNLVLKSTVNSFNSLILDSNRSADTQFAIIDGRWNGNVVNRIQFVTGSDGSNKDDGYMAFHTRESGSSLSERLRITSTGRIEVGTGSQVFGATPIEVKVSSSSGWNDYPEHISLVDQKAYNASDNGSGIVFGGKYNNSGSVTTFSSIHSKKANTTDGNFGGILTFNTREHGNSNFERMRIDSAGRVFINSVGATTPTADYRSLNIVAHAHSEAAVSFSRSHTLMGSGSTAGKSIILMPDGALSFQTHNVGERLRITSSGKIGINNTDPGGRTGSIDTSSNDSTSGRAFTDLRGHSSLILRNPNTTANSFTQMSFINGGGTQAATLLRHRLGSSHGSLQNYVGDLCLFRRTGGNGGANNDYRESVRWCGSNPHARQIWWAYGDNDTAEQSRLGWHHLSAQRDHPGTDAYSFFRLETGAASYARQGWGKYTCAWTTGHASGYGLATGHFGYYMHHNNSRIYVNEHIIYRERYSNGSYYSWDDAPNLRICNYTQSGGTNAGIVFRCGGRRYSGGFDMGVMVGLFIDLYVPETANGDTNPRLYVAGDSQSNLDGGGHGSPVNHDYVSFQSSNPNHGAQP